MIFSKITNKCFAFYFLADEIILCPWKTRAKMKTRMLFPSFLLIYLILNLSLGLVWSWANLLVLLESEVDPGDRVSSSKHSNLMRRFSLKSRRRWVERNKLVFLPHKPNQFVFDLVKRLIVLLTPSDVVIRINRQILWTFLGCMTFIMLMTTQHICTFLRAWSSERRFYVVLKYSKTHVWSHKLIFGRCAEH